MTRILSGSPKTGQTNSALPGLRPAGVIFSLFFLSGAAGLLYEVAWFRRLQLVFGVSVFAIGAVVTAFMLGLAGGSRWAAAARVVRRQPLRVYAALEVCIGIYALLFPWLVMGVEQSYCSLFRGVEGHFLGLSAVRLALSLLLLLPPTFCMGATLPTLAEALAGDRTRLPRRAGWLYAVNTFGGVVGTLVAGFYSLEHWGIQRTIQVAAAVNLAIGATAWAISYSKPNVSSARSEPTVDGILESHAESGSDPIQRSRLRLALVIVGLTGLSSMALEVVWTRALVFYVHNSTYAFSAIVAVYLVGLAAGAGVAARIVKRGNAARLLLGVLVALGFSTILSIAAYRAAPSLLQPLLGSPLAPQLAGLADRSARIIAGWGTALVCIFTQANFVLFVPAFLFGAVFPLALQFAESGCDSSRIVGRMYAANTLGSVVGTLLGSFLLVPLLGTRGALLALAWLPALPATLLLMEFRMRRRVVMALVCGCTMVALGHLAAPAGFYRDLFGRRFGKVLWFGEGVADTVAICEHADQSAWIHYSDGRGASGTTSFRGGWLYAHVPLLLHPNPHSALVICFGTGNTLGAARLHPLDRVDGVELSSEVIKASVFFKETNHDVAHNPRVRIIIEDGRNYLLLTKHRYDVITEEPPLVHTAGVVNLYSKDFYQLCAERLTDNGIMAVWLATWEMEEADVQMLVRAFIDVFPYASVWDSQHLGEWILIGSKQPLSVDPGQLRTRMQEPALAGDLEKINIHSPADLLALYMKGREFLVAFSRDARPVTDDRSVVDYTIPREARANFGLGESITGGLNLTAAGPDGLVSELRFRKFDAIYTTRESASSLLAPGARAATNAFAVEIAARQAEAELQAGRKLAWNVLAAASDFRQLGDPATAINVLDRGVPIVGRLPSADLLVAEAELCYRTGRIPEAQQALARALAIVPDHQAGLMLKTELDR